VTLRLTFAKVENAQQGKFAPKGKQSRMVQEGGQAQSSVQKTVNVKGLAGSVLAFRGGHPESTPVIGSIFTHAGTVPTVQKKTFCGGVEHVVPIEAYVKAKGTHSGKPGGITGGAMSKAACTGPVFSDIPPRANVNETIMPRHNLNKPARRRPFPKFDILILLPPYLL